jgi:hypothetical protein
VQLEPAEAALPGVCVHGDREQIFRVSSRKKWPWVLGSEGFVSAVKERFFARKLDEEVPESRELAPEVDGIKKAVCEFYGVAEAELLVSRRSLSTNRGTWRSTWRGACEGTG